ncbi:MAG: C4-dicarboxylate ABC transporter permease [Spirochaetales bacterium]|nr:MAG: C4-dicarboxylate ABC transporter permease [Spirochaetales bacterium]
MMEFLLSVAGQLFTLKAFLFINIGLFVGLVFGAIPGLNGNLAITILLPFSFFMSPVNALLMLTSIFFAANFGGSVSSILINTPGTNAAVATLLDGYPLSQKGFPNKALNIALVSSTIGGLFSAFCLLFLSPQIAVFSLKFGAPEYFSIAIFGLSVIASVSGKSIVKGLIAGCFGVLISMVGLDSISGAPRFTFGNYNLLGGIKMLPALLGLFAITKMMIRVVQADEGVAITGTQGSSREDRLSGKEILSLLTTIFKSAGIGTIIGAIPGAGGGIASFLAYDEAKRRARKDEEFGTGEIRGVAAPEAANNGSTCATLIPLLTLGIPGDVVAATLLGAFMMHGLVPGPTLFTEQKATIYSILIGIVIANILLFFQGKLFLKYAVSITKVPMKLLTACLVVVVATGAYTFGNSVFDVKVLMFFGIIGYFLTKLEFPIIPIILGLVLGPIAEKNLRNALVLSQGNPMIFLTRPISLVFIILSFLFIILLRFSQKKIDKKRT